MYNDHIEGVGINICIYVCVYIEGCRYRGRFRKACSKDASSSAGMATRSMRSTTSLFRAWCAFVRTFVHGV